MIKLPLFKAELVDELYKNVELNYELYFNNNFEELLNLDHRAEFQKEFKELEVDEIAFKSLSWDSSKKTIGKMDAENSYILFNALPGLNAFSAADERMWTALTHTIGKNFLIKRWLGEKNSREDNIGKIRQHFFNRNNGGTRKFFRNGLSCLWWWAYISKNSNKFTHAETLTLLLTSTDFRDMITGHPGVCTNQNVFDAIISCFKRKMLDDPNSTFFTRRKWGTSEGIRYRKWFIKINMMGGTKLYSSFTTDQLENMFYDWIKDFEET